MLEETGRVGLVQLWHFLRLNELLLAVFLCLLDDLVEARILRHEFALEVKLKINVDSIILLDKLVKVQCINQSLILDLILHAAVLSCPPFACF